MFRIFKIASLCGVVLVGILPFALAADGTQAGPRYSDWSFPQELPQLNTAVAEAPNGISRDGLSLYFQRANADTKEDLYVVHRPDLESAWGVPIKLPDTVNSGSNDRAAFVSDDGHWLYFSSDRTGNNDIYVSWRTHVHDDSGWEQAVNLSAVNSVGFESGPTLYEDEASGATQLYFNSAPYAGGTQAVADIYVSTLGPTGFGTPVPVVELNSAVQEGRPYIRRDGCEIYFQSNRTAGGMAIWVSTRPSTAQPWSTPVLVMSPASLGDATVLNVTTPVLSWDQRTLFVGLGRGPGRSIDIFVSTREKLQGRD